MKQYLLCVFEYGYEGNLYQEIINGNLARLTDVDGNTLTLDGEYGYRIIDKNPPILDWMVI